jgi:hypothetical protein
VDQNPYAASELASQREPGQSVKRTIKRFEPIQLGKILGCLYFLMSLIFVPIFLIVAAGGHNGAGMGLGFAIALPVIYGVLGFIGGIIAAWLYNLCAKFVGGIQVEVE